MSGGSLITMALHLAAAFGAAEPPASGAEPVVADEIVVTGRGGAPRAEPDAVDVLRTFCFDPARRAGRPTEPDLMSRWFPLEPPARQQFKITDPAIPAFSLADELRQHELWLKIERLPLEAGLVEDRCTLLVIGGHDHGRFVAALNRLFRGVPTRRHVGHPHGVAALPGWEQWLWTGRPQRGSSSWRSIPAGPGAGGQSWVVVLDPNSFYAQHDYVYGDLKTRRGDRALSLLTFGVVRRTGK